MLLRRGISRPRLDRRVAVEMVRFGARVYLAAVLSFLVIRLDLMLVNAIRGSAQAGLYSVAAVIAQGLIVVPYAIGMNLFPRVARGSQATFTASVFRHVAVLYGGVCLVMVPLAWPLVHWLYGPRFDASLPMVVWLLPGTYAFGMLTILSLHFAGRGYPRAANVIWALAVLLNVVLNIVLLPLFGTVMASITSTITYVFVLALHTRLFARMDPPAPSLRPSVRETLTLVRSRLRARSLERMPS
jgi:O-antigen/teichoic acid export membrane protein